jgi:hypothetical protein
MCTKHELHDACLQPIVAAANRDIISCLLDNVTEAILVMIFVLHIFLYEIPGIMIKIASRGGSDVGPGQPLFHG